MNALRSLLRSFGILLAAAAMLTGCQGSGSSEESLPPPDVTGDLTVKIFDVGKADAMVIQTSGTVTVLDTGLKGDGKRIETYLTEQGIDKIDTLIITHFDKDHVGGAPRLVNRMKIGTIYIPDYASGNPDYISFVTKTDAAEFDPTVVPMGETIEWKADDAAFRLDASQQTDYGENEENDFSLALYVKHGYNTLFFAGDAEAPRQKEMMALHLGAVKFLKFPYHGNYLNTTEEFLDAFRPQITVICCSAKESADPETMETLKKRGIETYTTVGGDITVVSDGSQLTCTQGAQ